MGKGVGTRDVSFLYDVVHQHEPSPPSLSKLDKSSVRIEAVEVYLVNAFLSEVFIAVRAYRKSSMML